LKRELVATDNKALIVEFFSKFKKKDLAGVFAMIHEDVVWWSVGGKLWPFSGEKGKEVLVRNFTNITSMFPDGLDLVPGLMIAEADRIAVEVAGRAVTAAGTVYDNTYFFAFEIKDNKIIRAREYHDTLYAKSVLLPNG
jgi:ketosteroid isomerase-like protein